MNAQVKKLLILTGLLLVTLVVGYFIIAPVQVLERIIHPQARNKFQTIVDKIPTQAGKALFLRQSNNLTRAVDPELVDLDSQIISCNPDVTGLFSSNPTIGGSCLAGSTTLQTTKGMYLGGQCCGALTDTKEYHQHLEALQKYKNIPDIVLDPYKTPITLAKKWIDYDNQTTLSDKDQQIYKQALTVSHEGPCCCKCWHYYVNEGIAKKLIKDYGYSAQQVADFWDVSDICGV
ncbi:hypothetical protein HY029_04320 [Candidatus Gottesmanbacteria bacterium]|nr:hypothetical protein [Candidatus Gottesmanbacteria bacterium]